MHSAEKFEMSNAGNNVSAPRWCEIAVIIFACLSTFAPPQQVVGAPPLRDGSVRLRGGAHKAQGNVEIFHDNEWRPVCDDNWDMRSARVVCRQLGFLHAIEATTASEFGLTNVGGGGNKFWLDDVSRRSRQKTRCN